MTGTNGAVRDGSMTMLDDESVLMSGGTGAFGNRFGRNVLHRTNARRVLPASVIAILVSAGGTNVTDVDTARRPWGRSRTVATAPRTRSWTRPI